MNNYNENNLNRDIIAIKNLMLSQSPENRLISMLSGKNTFRKEHYDTLYAFGTEDMTTYYRGFTTTTNFLTVCASGDQVINAALSGATIIDAFDKNRLTRYALNLKLAALKALSKEDFLEYYETFSPFLFSVFAKHLPQQDLYFWTTIYQIFDIKIVGQLIRDFIFSYKRLKKDEIIKINPYLQGSNYKKAQEAIKNAQINYIDSDLYGLDKNLPDTEYDAINLSNIYEYINYGEEVSEKSAHEFYTFIIKYLFSQLRENGSIMLAYTYAFTDKIKAEFDKLYQEKGYITYPGALNYTEMLDYYMGLTSQNLSYSYLYDQLGSNEEQVKKVLTRNFAYGQSSDMSHDSAVFIKK